MSRTILLKYYLLELINSSPNSSSSWIQTRPKSEQTNSQKTWLDWRNAEQAEQTVWWNTTGPFACILTVDKYNGTQSVGVKIYKWRVKYWAPNMQQHYGCTLQRLQVNRSNLCGRAVRLVSLGQSGPMPTHLGGARQGRCTMDCLESADHLERLRKL